MVYAEGLFNLSNSSESTGRAARSAVAKICIQRMQKLLRAFASEAPGLCDGTSNAKVDDGRQGAAALF